MTGGSRNMSIITLLLLCLSLGSALAVLIPRHNCGDYFTYATENGGNGYIGIFTAPKTGVFHWNWKAVFDSHGQHSQLPVETLRPYPNKDDAARHIYDGQRAQTFVRFVNITTELPKLVLLEVNGETLCQNPGYGIPYTRANLEFNMNVSVKRTQKPCAHRSLDGRKNI